MKIRTNIKSGKSDNPCPPDGCGGNHNEKLASDINIIEQKRSFAKKLRLNKETVRILKDSDLETAAGGRRPSEVDTCKTCDTCWLSCNNCP